jgi:Predicted transcriptional regulators
VAKPDPIAVQLTQARRAAGLTQAQVAESIHVAHNTIHNWEHGKSQPRSLADLAAWAQAVGRRLVLTEAADG